MQVWSKVLEDRTVKFNPRVEEAKNLEALGIIYNGDGTWTIPAGRFTDGGLYQWSVHRGTRQGETRLLDPNWENNTGNQAWGDKNNSPGKEDSYIAQHAVQAVTMAPVLKAVAGEDYLANGPSISGATAWELYSGYALQWMRQSPEWMSALGFKLHKSYPYQRGDSTTAGTDDQRGFGTGFIDTDYFARWDEYAAVFDPTMPDPATRQMFTLTGTKKGFEFRLDDIPHDGWSRLTDIEIRIGNGDWLSTGITNIGESYAYDIKAGAYLVAMRALNAFGASQASGTKQVEAGKVSKPPAGGSGSSGGGSSGGGSSGGRAETPSGRTDTPGSRVATASPSRLTRVSGNASTRLITAPTRLSVEFLRTATPVPVPPSLPLMLGALGALSLASRYRAREG